MELALNLGSLITAGYSYLEALDAAERLGFRFIELWVDEAHLWPYNTTPQQRREALEALKARGLKAVSLCPLPFHTENWIDFHYTYNLADPEEEARKRAVKFYRDIMAEAVELEAPRVLTMPGQVREPNFMKGPTYRTYWEQMVRSLRELARQAEDLGVTLGLENTVVGGFVDRPEELLLAVEEVGSPRVRVYLDVANANTFYPPLHYIEVLEGQLIDLLHVPDNDGRTPQHLPPGRGDIDFPAIIRALREDGWDGYLIPEIFYAEDPLGGLRESRDHLSHLIGSEERKPVD